MTIRHPDFPNGNIYLSGGMQYAEDLGGAWRAELSPKLKELGFFPIDIVELDKAYSAEYGDMYGPNSADSFLQTKCNIREHFVNTDLQLIEEQTDALIVLYDDSARLGCGTKAECQHAYNLNIPVFLVSVYPDWERQVPIWLQALTTKIFTDMDSLMTYISGLPAGILVKDRYGNHHDGNGNYLCFLSGEVFKKQKKHFVSHVSPLYSQDCVDLVVQTREREANRYEFILNYFKEKM